jgi:hypothetical protein
MEYAASIQTFVVPIQILRFGVSFVFGKYGSQVPKFGTGSNDVLLPFFISLIICFFLSLEMAAVRLEYFTLERV